MAIETAVEFSEAALARGRPYFTDPDTVERWVRAVRTYDDAVANGAERLALARAEAMYDVALPMLALVFTHAGESAVAAACYRRIVARDPTNRDARCEATWHAVMSGDVERGWADFHAWRLSIWRDFDPAHWATPYWDGRPLAGRRILMRPDLGLGDTIQFGRYAPLLVERAGGRVVLEVSQPLARLARRQRGVEVVVSGPGLRPAASSWRVDTWVLGSSLAHLFGITRETVPPPDPSLRPDPALVARWRAPVRAFDGGYVVVGLNWAGSSTNPNWASRDVPLAALAPLAGVAGVHYVALQKTQSNFPGWVRPPDGGPEAEPAPPGLSLLRLGPRFEDLADCAAAMMSLDLVVTTDTSIAHLAGTLGRPTWLLLSAAPECRWGGSGEDCPWYPSVRVFRQERLGDWASVVDRVADELRRLAMHRRYGALRLVGLRGSDETGALTTWKPEEAAAARS